MSTCGFFLYYARKTPGFGGVWWFCAEIFSVEVRLFLNGSESQYHLRQFQELKIIASFTTKLVNSF
jgi:hypothetical protein